jgi:hypothetical protein
VVAVSELPVSYFWEAGVDEYCFLAFQPTLGEKRFRNKRMELFHHLQNTVYALEFKFRGVYDGNNIFYTPQPLSSDKTVSYLFIYILSLNRVDPPFSSMSNWARIRPSLLKPTARMLFDSPLHQAP